MRKFYLLLVLGAFIGCNNRAANKGDEDGETPPLNAILNRAPGDEPKQDGDGTLDDAGKMRQRGNEFFAQGDFDQAIEFYTAAIDAKADAKSYFCRGTAHLSKEELDKALADFDKAVQLDPTATYLRIDRSQLLQRMGKTAQGINDLDEALKHDAKNANILLQRGLLYVSIGMFDRARDDLSKAIEISPTYTAYINRGYCLHQKKLYKDALTDFDQAIKLAPANPLAWSNRGNSYTQLSDFDKAIADLDEAIKLDGRDPQYYNNRGSAYGAKGDHRRAATDFTRAIELDPEYTPAYRNRGLAYHTLGEKELARVDFQLALQLQPTVTDGIPAEYLAK
ncbi:MAG TPA: tetratricopeptide repeat protein [Gemmataceae bacterium]|nr:tetratricopeptide repeat protein [Gemmataceae bacterium]